MAPTDASGAAVSPLVEELAAVLTAARIPEAKREAADIVAALLDAPRFWAASHAGESVSADHAAAMRAAAARRANGAPFAYAVGRAAFRHLTLAVDERVLIPRVETEELVQRVLDEMTDESGGTAVDLGTGSGAIALALAQEGRFARVIATDISNGALAVARANAAACAPMLNCPVEFRAGEWLAPLAGVRARAVASNPPYIAQRRSGRAARVGARLGAAGGALRRGLRNARHRVYHSRGAHGARGGRPAGARSRQPARIAGGGARPRRRPLPRRVRETRSRGTGTLPAGETRRGVTCSRTVRRRSAG